SRSTAWKWTPDFGPEVKVVRGACSRRSRSDEADAYEIHAGIQGEGGDRRLARAGNDPGARQAVRRAPQPDLHVEAGVHPERRASVRQRRGDAERERRQRARGAAAQEDRGADGRARFFSQRARASSLTERRTMIDRESRVLSVRRQCELLRVSRSGL